MANEIQHPDAVLNSAPSQLASPAKYLIRDDGVVFPYDAITAQDSRWTPSNELPKAHLVGISKAIARERLLEEVTAAQAAEQEKEVEKQVKEVLLAENVRVDNLVEADAKIPDPKSEDLLRVDEARIAGATNVELVKYAKEEFNMDLSLKTPMPLLLSEIRMLQASRR